VGTRAEPLSGECLVTDPAKISSNARISDAIFVEQFYSKLLEARQTYEMTIKSYIFCRRSFSFLSVRPSPPRGIISLVVM
jgi:hypothetical protein